MKKHTTLAALAGLQRHQPEEPAHRAPSLVPCGRSVS